MDRRKPTIMVVACILALGVVAFASADVWPKFTSSANFSVTYPGNWFRIGVSADRLQLLSSRGGAEGIVIRRGQAEIIVMEAKGSSTKTVAQVIDYYTQGASILSRRDVSDKSSKQGCSDLEEVTSKEEAIPPGASPISVPYIVNNDLFCQLDGRKIVTLLRNWEGDERQGEYQQIALRMARSIRLAQRK